MTTRSFIDTLADHQWGDTPGGSNTNWSPSTTPTLTEDAVLNESTPANVIASAVTSECKSLDCTGFVHDLSNTLYVHGNVIFGSGMTAQDLSLFISANGSITPNGVAVYDIIADGVTSLSLNGDITIYRNFETNDAGTIALGTHKVTLLDTVNGADGLYLNAGTTLTWSTGSEIHYSLIDGNSTYITDADGSNQFPPLFIAKSGGSGTGVLKLNLTATFYSLTLSSGTLDPNAANSTISHDMTLSGGTLADQTGSVFSVSGNFVSSGVNLSGGSWLVTGSATAHGATIANSDFSGGSTLDASDGCTDGGGNTNVSFVTLGPSAPVITGITTDTGSSASDGITSDDTLIIAGTSVNDADIEVFLDDVSIGTTTADGSGDWSFDYTATEIDPGDHAITAIATVASVPSDPSSAFDITIDTIGSIATAVTTDHADGGVVTSNTIHVDVTFPDAQTVTGTPRLLFDQHTGTIARYINYASGTGTVTLRFTMTVLASDSFNAVRVLGINLNGGTIKDVAGNQCSLVIPQYNDIGGLDAPIYTNRATSYATQPQDAKAFILL